MSNMTNIAYDCGQGNGKLVGPHGWTMLESYAARLKGASVGGLDGLRSKQARLTIGLANGQTFAVGRNAHAVGEPVEALDYDRYSGAPEQRALFYGILTAYMQTFQADLRDTKLRLTIGVPLPVLASANGADTLQRIQAWLLGEHRWQADGQGYQATISEVRVKSQAVGALYYYLHDDEGRLIPERKNTLVAKQGSGGPSPFVPIGILSFGFLTMEALGVEYQRDPVTGKLELVKEDRFTASRPVGMHRLLDVARPGPEYTLAELDQLHRDGLLNTQAAMTIYQRDVSNALIETWGRTGWRRFGLILMVGGGAVELGQWLLNRFEGKAFLPQATPESNGHYRDAQGHDLTPILAIALGLYRQSLRSKD